MDVMRNVSVWPGMEAIAESVIVRPRPHPQPAEACCGDFDEPEIGSVERLYPEGRQRLAESLDDCE